MTEAGDFHETGLVRQACGEVVVEGNARLTSKQGVCSPCDERITELGAPRSAP
ncbi:hypothetical protein [Thiocystis violacea]|uniref:hypothetical protein n=1 Tax=Thiocystis violacea TaxID=13725 RepID=UPI001908A40E|nr:hypothetical protein [Thiocystis violacea]